MNNNELMPVTFQADIEQTKTLCAMLMQQPHYAKLGPDGVFAIVETAKSIGLDPRQALNGDLYFVKGKVELTARAMNKMIRSKGHSITKDSRSDDTICILHAKRADTGDCWSESFSIAEAQRAGLANSPVWKTYPRDMLFNRALSRLARQLFPDLIHNLYVEGEISLDPNISDVKLTHSVPVQKDEIVLEELLSESQLGYLDHLLEGNPDNRKLLVSTLLKARQTDDLRKMPKAMYYKAIARLEELNAEKQTMQEQYVEVDDGQ